MLRVTLSCSCKKYEIGSNEEPSKKIFTSRGIGIEGGKLLLQMNFNWQPEITLIEIS